MKGTVEGSLILTLTNGVRVVPPFEFGDPV